MTRFILWRAAQVLPMMILVSVAMFVAMRMVPGGPTAVYSQAGLSAEAIAAIRIKLGLDDPIALQYARWLQTAMNGDLGYSFSSGRPVLTEIVDRLGPTLYLMGSTLIVVLLISIPLGIFQAIRQYSRADVVVTTSTFVGASMPVFWFALVVIMVDSAIRNPSTGKPYLPIGGMQTPGAPVSVPDLLSHLALPLFVLAFGWVSWYSRYVRSSMLDVIHQDYIRAARARGLSDRRVIFKHAFKNAAIPLMTVVALDLPFLFAGSLYVEIIFGWPGMGQLFYHAVTFRDYPVMIGVVVIIAALVLLANLAADVGYAFLDPRVRYRRG